MKVSWRILVLVVKANTLYYVLGYVAQALDHGLQQRHSIIPGTDQKFLYVQDLWRTGIADLIGMALIFNVFFHLAWQGKLGLWHWLAFAAIVVVSLLVFFLICLGPDHKPDVGFPASGTVSANGLLHLPYLGVAIAATCICLWFMAIGDLQGPILWMCIAGGAFYVAFFIWEIQSGNLDPLHKL